MAEPARKPYERRALVQRIPQRLERRKRLQLALRALDDYPEGHDRPRTRGACLGQDRPCPWVSCKHHLYLDVHPETGALKLNFPDLEPWELDESCSLDVADRGGVTLEEVGELMALTKERIRQIEVHGLRTLKQNVPAFLRPDD